MSEIKQAEGGEPGEPGKPGGDPPDNKGGDGGAGGVGVPGAPGAAGAAGATGASGDRGQRGDKGLTGTSGLDGAAGETGADGEKGNTGRRGSQGDSGPMGVAGRDGLNVGIVITSRLAKTLLYFSLSCFSIIVILALVITIRGQKTIDGLNDQLGAITVDRANEQAVEDCRNLYLEDITFARITRDIEAGHQSATVALIPLDTPPDERLAIQQQAADELTVKDIVLIEAGSAFKRYITTFPVPLDCPHPDIHE